jgi:hypothetical protein
MQTHPVAPAQDTTGPGAIGPLVASWRRSLAARRVSPATIATYTSAVGLLAAFRADRGMPATLPPSAASTSSRSSPTTSGDPRRRPPTQASAGSRRSSIGSSTRASSGRARWPG